MYKVKLPEIPEQLLLSWGLVQILNPDWAKFQAGFFVFGLKSGLSSWISPRSGVDKLVVFGGLSKYSMLKDVGREDGLEFRRIKLIPANFPDILKYRPKLNTQIVAESRGGGLD